MNDERKKKLEDRQVWLENSVVGLRKSYARLPKMALLMLAVVPAYIWGTGLFTLFVGFIVCVFVGVTVYITWGHLHEHETELKTVKSELRKHAKNEDNQAG
jgi:hypothetical protein